MIKVIIAGGRNFSNYQLLNSFCEKILKNQTIAEIVSGHAKGADALGEKYAIEKNIN